MSRWVVHPGQGDNPTSLYTHKSRTHLSTHPMKDTRHTELVVEPRYSSGFIFFKESAVKMPKQNCSKTPSNRVFHWDREIYQPRNMWNQNPTSKRVNQTLSRNRGHYMTNLNNALLLFCGEIPPNDPYIPPKRGSHFHDPWETESPEKPFICKTSTFKACAGSYLR